MQRLLCLVLLAVLGAHVSSTIKDNYDCKARNVTASEIEEEKHHKEEEDDFEKRLLPLWLALDGERKGSGKPTDPQQIKISYGNGPSEMWVMWITFENTTNSLVNWGTSKDKLSHKTPGFVYIYRQGITGWDGFIHKVVLKHLQPDTQYFYECGSTESMSGIFDFKTQPATPKEFTVAAFGDMGAFPGGGIYGPETTDAMIPLMDKFDFVMDAGDIAYAYGYMPVWDFLGRQIQPIAAKKPWMTAVGNHERPYNFTAYKMRYPMPHEASNSTSTMWYSFDYGFAHFIVLSTEHPHHKGTPQHKWAIRDLRKASKARATTKVKWIIAIFHKPIYCSNNYTSCHGYAAGMRFDWEDTFFKYGVDVTIFGHVHAMERTWPVYNCMKRGDYSKPGGPVHLLLGRSGAIEDGDYWHHPTPAWSAYHTLEYGFSMLKFVNDSVMEFEYWANHKKDAPWDKFTLTRGSPFRK